MADDLIPIDIQCNKLVDWLIDRRHCNIKWQTSNEVVKKKIADALQDMPSTPEMKQLLEGSCFHFFKCQKIVNELKNTEKDSKNIFGMYSSTRIKDWQEIVKLYQKENLHLAELSSRLLRNLNYEIPALKKQIVKCSQVQEESRKKILECKRNTDEVKRKYADECKKVGIEGKDVKNELLDLVRDLPKEFTNIGLNCKNLLPVLEYYAAFVEFSLGENSFCDKIAPLLKYLSKSGDTTIYQFVTGNVPDVVVKINSMRNDKEDDNKNNEGEDIDWGFSLEEGDKDSAVYFGIEEEDEEGFELEIEVEENGNNGFEIISKDEENWEIEKVSHREIPNGTKIQCTERIAEGEDALTLLECITTRTQIINELLELEGFLDQRFMETRRESDVLSINQFQSAPPILQLTSSNEIEVMLDQITSIHRDLTSTKMIHLCRILDSPKFVDRLSDTLSRQLSLTQKYKDLKSSLELRIEESLREQSYIQPKIEVLVKEVKEWKVLIENDISGRYKNRPVHLMGTINML